MTEYHKIQTVFKRDPATKYRTLLLGEFSTPEFGYLRDNLWVFTEKVDGMNIRVVWANETITFGGKTNAAQIPAHLINALNQMFLPQVERFREVFPDGLACLYGEGYGAKIQKGGGSYRPDQGFVLFDVRVGEWWLQRADVDDVASKFGLDVVPMIGAGTLEDLVGLVRGGFQSRWGDFAAEGIVARPETELMTRGGQRIITKLKHRDFGGSE